MAKNNWKKSYKMLRADLTAIVKWPPKKYSRRTKDGYPREFTYNERTYKRMIDQYRIAIRHAIKVSRRGEG